MPSDVLQFKWILLSADIIKAGTILSFCLIMVYGTLQEDQ